MAVATNGPVELYYETFGRSNDDALLLVNGLGSQCINFDVDLCQRFVDEGFFVIRFDNRDVGLSTKFEDFTPHLSDVRAAVRDGRRPEVPYGLSDMANDAVAVLDALNIRAAHVVGVSMGGMIVQQLAIDHRERLSSMTSIMSTTGRPGLPPGDADTLAVLTRPPKSSSREDLIDNGILVRHALASPGFPQSEADIRAFVERVVDRAPYDPAGIARQLAAIIAAPPRNELLKAVRRPALVLHGDSDRLLPVAAAKDTAESIPGAELIIVPGMGHDFAPALGPVYLKHIGDFISSVEAETAAAQ